MILEQIKCLQEYWIQYYNIYNYEEEGRAVEESEWFHFALRHVKHGSQKTHRGFRGIEANAPDWGSK